MHEDGWQLDELAHAGPEQLRRAGLEIDDTWYAGSRTYARYVCRMP